MNLYFQREQISKPLEIVTSIKKHGIAIFPQYLLPSELARIVPEFKKVFEHTELLFEGRNPNAAKANATDLLRLKLEGLYHLFFSKEFVKISKAFWGANQFAHCHDIYIMKDIIGTKTYAHDLHFDVIPQLKFYFYLNDVQIQNGAFEYVPGSQQWTKSVRGQKSSEFTFENRQFSRNLPKELSASIPLEAPAGTLVIFDTDMFHKAGTVVTGERWVIRGHTRQAEGRPFFQSLIGKTLAYIKDAISP